ncbi:unnamed protein product [Caenorhabditis auriculariae]|uniref:hydroxymethylglutaryl-CoA synthase n=1 Tax=Caenorhabditis auriculariae TaxID=2777116 RepID=A0A8S1HMD2_9PELO|nr:unnamed protein product [Caenorhabditis auriculariae]
MQNGIWVSKICFSPSHKSLIAYIFMLTSNAAENVGIDAIEFYFPRNYVEQTDLEKFDSVSSGKYTIGLGQQEMGFCADNEDIVSISLTATSNLLEKYNIDKDSIGCLVVGTETLIDKSKSVKTALMELFGGNTDIEGVDVKNACFGGTQALLHAIDWIYVKYPYEKRCAIVVLADIAIYDSGPARCTGGAGAVAVLIKPNAAIPIDRFSSSVCMKNTWDFYKPIGAKVTEYPVVNGQDSLHSYVLAVQTCYNTYREKVKRIHGKNVKLDDFSAIFFHCPFTKLVRKALAILSDLDKHNTSESFDGIELMNNRVLMDNSIKTSEQLWKEKTDDFLVFNRRIGNMYTPSLFAQFMAFLTSTDWLSEPREPSMLFFAYGSGFASAIFSARICLESPALPKLQEVARAAFKRLDERKRFSAEDFTRVLKMREDLLHSEVPFTPKATDCADLDLKLPVLMARSRSSDSSEGSQNHYSEDEGRSHRKSPPKSKSKARRRNDDDDYSRDSRPRKKERRSESREDRRRHSRTRSPSPHRGSRSSRSSRNNDSKHRGSARSSRPAFSSSLTNIGPPAIDQNDFDSWMGILSNIENQKDNDYVREKYWQFLDRYPYCYGFWQKFAEFEKRQGNLTEALKVWEKSILAIPLSIDLWLGFLAFMRELSQGMNEKEEEIRELYERALSIAGLEFQSDRLWLDAIGWEQHQYVQALLSGRHDASAVHVGKLFDRLLATPTAAHSTHITRYAAYINGIEPDVLLTDEEYEDVLSKARKNVTTGIDDLFRDEEVTRFVKLAEDGRTWVQVDPSASEEEGVRIVVGREKKHDADLLHFMRYEILDRRQKLHQDTALFTAKRLNFENQIKRPYFHVKPLEFHQLLNWIAYLDFEIQEGEDERVNVLFERCLIACALYEEFWIKYARWMWAQRKSESKVRDIYQRASVHVGNSAQLAIARASFEEARGDFEGAIEVLEKFKRQYPGFVVVEMRILSTMRRQVESEKNSNYADVITAYEKLIYAPDTSRHLSSFYAEKLARFLAKVRNDRKAADKVLRKAIERDYDNIKLFLQVIDLVYSTEEMSETSVLDAFDFALKSQLGLEDKIRISQRKLDFLEELSSDVELIEEHEVYHYSLVSQLPATAPIRTRFMNGNGRLPMAPMQWGMGGVPQQMGQVMNQQPVFAPTVVQAQIQPPVQLQIVENVASVASVGQTPETFNSPIAVAESTPME